MKYVLLMMSFCAFSYAAPDNAVVRVYEAGQEVSLDSIEVTVGTELEFVLAVDANDYWSGGLFISNDDRDLGYFTGRDPDPNTRDCEDSHLQAAGELAEVTMWEDTYIKGFDLFGSLLDTAAGDWFVLDYHPEKVGICNVNFHDYQLSWNNPKFQISITQILPGDCTGDSVVDMNDFSVLSSYWNVTDCNDPNGCGLADLDSDGNVNVNVNDMMMMANNWLLGASYEPNIPAEPNAPADPNYAELMDPNVVYCIVDANGFSEITIDVNDTVTLYVDKTSTDPSVYQVIIISVEIHPSDPNQGYIDNTPYDSNEPPGPGTARILFEPRWSVFDNWGPGTNYPYAIEFFAVDFNPIADGNLLSFEYTATKEGDVVLELYAETTPYPMLESILIHQVDPN